MALTKYPGDDYIKQLISAALVGTIKADANSNYLLGQNITIDERSVGNFVTADNAKIIQAHNNFLHAKNVEISFASGVAATGADHIILKGADYANVFGDAHRVTGYASTTNGFGCKNHVSYGVCEGNTCRLGVEERPNQFYGSSARGQNIVVEGTNSHGTGANFTIIGDNIIVNGIGTGQTITAPGVHNL